MDVKKYGQFIDLPVLGRMVHFVYDAKLKDYLPYWDRFPLVIPADFQDNQHFLGWNLHYIPTRARKTILDQLFKHAEMEPTAALKANYYFLKGIAVFDLIKPCIKSYLYSHVQSRFLEIAPINWYKVLGLPTAEWQKGKPY